jgi:hypothetical protein
LYQTKRSHFEKELDHIAGYTLTIQRSQCFQSSSREGWIGINVVFYESPNDGSVKIEQWDDVTVDDLNSAGISEIQEILESIGHPRK